MTRKRFDSAPQINVKDEGLLIQQVAGSTANLLDIKKSDNTSYVAVDSSGNVALPATTSIGNVSSTELGYLDGVTSAIQTQLNALLPVGMVVPFAGTTSPTGWLLCDGTAQSRTTYSSLFSSFATTFTSATTTNASTTVSGLSGMSSATHVGWGISGTNIPSGATITSVTNATTVVISANATGTATGTANIAISPYGFTGAGNTTTFNVPDLRGRIPAGKDNMGGSTASRITSATSGISATILGAAGGDQRLHAHDHPNSVATSGHTHAQTSSFTSTFQLGNGYKYTEGETVATQTINTGSASASTTVGNNTQGGGSQNVQPTVILNYIIKF